MYLVYLFIVSLVTCLLALGILFPFCKVWWRIRSRHRVLWASEGPFTLRSMLASGYVAAAFFDLANGLHENAEMRQKDPVLARWSLRCSQIAAMRPRGFMGQVLAAALFLYFVHFFTTLVFRITGLE